MLVRGRLCCCLVVAVAGLGLDFLENRSLLEDAEAVVVVPKMLSVRDGAPFFGASPNKDDILLSNEYVEYSI